MHTIHRSFHTWLHIFVAIVIGVMGLTSMATAVMLEIPAVSFVLRCSAANCPGSGADAFGEEAQGLLLNAKGRYFAPVVFPPTEGRVCSFTLWYRDNDSDIDLIAHLKRKRGMVGISAFTPPLVMATIQSTGANDTLQKAVDTTIRGPIVRPARFFYFVEVEVPGNTLEVLGVQIDYRPTCP